MELPLPVGCALSALIAKSIMWKHSGSVLPSKRMHSEEVESKRSVNSVAACRLTVLTEHDSPDALLSAPGEKLSAPPESELGYNSHSTSTNPGMRASDN